MTSTLISSPAHPEVQQSHIFLDGVQWSTFQTLVAELQPDSARALGYDARGVSLRQQHPDVTEAANWVLLEGLSWRTYQALLNDANRDRSWRIAYAQGVLEIRMPSAEHEEPKEVLSDFITVMVDELDWELRKLGALTLDREDLTRAIEPDACFYIQNEPKVRGRRIQLPTDPPPDLAIASDYTNSSLNKQDIYAAIGVPELWRYRQQQLEIYVLAGDRYNRTATSSTFPFFPVAEVPKLINQCQEIGQRKAVKAFRVRIQELIGRQRSVGDAP